MEPPQRTEGAIEVGVRLTIPGLPVASSLGERPPRMIQPSTTAARPCTRDSAISDYARFCLRSA